MEERQVSIDGQTRKLPEPFFVIATQNPVEQIGAYPLPESQLDRFLMALELGYPDAAAERELLAGGDRRARIAEMTALADAPTLVEWQREAAALHVAPALLDYVQALLAASRGQPAAQATADTGAKRGLSPRAGLMLLNAARAWALVGGPADGAARGRAGGVPVGRRPSARRRRARRRARGAVAAARGAAAVAPAIPSARSRPAPRSAARGSASSGTRRPTASRWCCGTRASTSCRRAAAGSMIGDARDHAASRRSTTGSRSDSASRSCLPGSSPSSLLHAFRNLAGIDVRPLAASETFAGGRIAFTLVVGGGERTREAIEVSRAGLRRRRGRPAGRSARRRMRLERDAPRADRMALGRVTLASTRPLGLWRAWSYIHFPLAGVVYPAPEPGAPAAAARRRRPRPRRTGTRRGVRLRRPARVPAGRPAAARRLEGGRARRGLVHEDVRRHRRRRTGPARVRRAAGLARHRDEARAPDRLGAGRRTRDATVLARAARRRALPVGQDRDHRRAALEALALHEDVDQR